MNMRDILMVFGVAAGFFITGYVFVSVMTGQFLHLQPTGFNVLVIATVLGMIASFINVYKRDNEELEE